MNAEDTKSLETLRLALARKTATTFGICAVITIISLVYAYIQSTEANAQRDKAIASLEKAVSLEEKLKLCQLK